VRSRHIAGVNTCLSLIFPCCPHTCKANAFAQPACNNLFQNNMHNPALQAQLQTLLDQKTKPPGSLGALETLALRLGMIQDTTQPHAQPAQLLLFAGDHGVHAQGVSPYPQAVTAQMVANILAGGAASSVLAKQYDMPLTVIDVGVAAPLATHPQLVHAKVRAGTRDLSREAAMTHEELQAALQAGRAAVRASNAAVLLVGEMGIANTTPASAITCALLGLDAATVAGPGTGLNAQGIAHKAQVIACALQLHADRTPLEVLRCLGGLEIAAMTGAYLEGAARGCVLLMDGFIATAALLVAVRMQPDVLHACVFSHTSGEPGHTHVLRALNAQPLLNLGLRLGEGTGALTAYPLLQSACAMLNNMASFSSAGVAGINGQP
jgi:nicotinate-nucleotide--dimethylbenzimidazole phosphoribosyltransferase